MSDEHLGNIKPISIKHIIFCSIYTKKIVKQYTGNVLVYFKNWNYTRFEIAAACYIFPNKI